MINKMMLFVPWDRNMWGGQKPHRSLIGYWNVIQWHSLNSLLELSKEVGHIKKSLKNTHTQSVPQGSYTERTDRPHSFCLINWKQQSHQIPSSSSPPPPLACLSTVSHCSLFPLFCSIELFLSFLCSVFPIWLLTFAVMLHHSSLSLISHSNLAAEKNKGMTSPLYNALPPSLALKRKEKDRGVDNVRQKMAEGKFPGQD